MMKLEGKVSIVTGGNTGIGRAIAELFALEGSKVVVAGRRIDAGNETVRAIEDAGGRALFFRADVSDSSQVQGIIQTSLDTFGRIDILVNNAGGVILGSILDTEEKAWNELISINLTSVYLCSKAVLPHMIEQGSGSIINMTSTLGAHDAAESLAAYVASKGGVAMLTKAMAVDHAKDGVRVNAIAPGPVDTNMLRDNFPQESVEAIIQSLPMKRLGLSRELAATALFLASEEASFITGSILTVDGGQTAQV